MTQIIDHIFLANDQQELIKLLKGRVTRYLVIVHIADAGLLIYKYK